VPRASAARDNVAAIRASLSRRGAEIVAGRALAVQRGLLRREGLAAQQRATLAELAIADAELATRRAQQSLGDDTLAQWRALEQQHFVSTLQLRQQQAAALAQRAELQALLRQRAAVARNLGQVRQALAEWPAEQQAALDPFDRELAALEQQRIELDATHESAITAQLPGTVTSILVKAGESVQAGQQLLSVLPVDAVLQAELLLPSRAIGFVRPGDAVQLRYQAFPYQKFGHHRGLVRQVGRNAVAPAQARALLGSLAIDEPFYRVTVELASQSVDAYGRAEPLKPGMLLEADIVGDRRSLVEWLLEPLHALRSPLSGR
jgi:membrane fusion protein